VIGEKPSAQEVYYRPEIDLRRSAGDMVTWQSINVVRILYSSSPLGRSNRARFQILSLPCRVRRYRRGLSMRRRGSFKVTGSNPQAEERPALVGSERGCQEEIHRNGWPSLEVRICFVSQLSVSTPQTRPERRSKTLPRTRLKTFGTFSGVDEAFCWHVLWPRR
jgi:hypothetical protein